MASLLYRLGRFSARRAWLVLTAWALLLGLVATGAGTLGKPFTSTMSIPGTEFQRVLDDLQTSLPKAASGIGTVVLSTADGTPFTAPQKAAVADVVRAWGAIEGVDTALDPFVTQQHLDDAITKAADGAAQLADGKSRIATNQAKLTDGEKKLADGERQLATNETKLADGAGRLTAGKAELAAAQRRIDSGAADLAAAQRRLDAGAAKAAAGRREVDAAQAKITSGRRQWTAGQAEVAAGRQQWAAGNAQLKAGRSRLADGRAQLAALTAQYGPDDARVVALRDQLAAEQARLDTSAEQLAATRTRLDAAQRRLDATKAQLDAGQRALDAKKPAVLAAERSITDGRAELAAGRRKLDAARSQLAAGRAELATREAELAAGQAKLAQGRADLAKARADLADGKRKLADAQAELATGEAELALGTRRLALTEGLRTVTATGDAAVTQVLFDQPINSVPVETKQKVTAAAEVLAAQEIRVDYSKDIMQDLAFFGPGELLGLAVAALVLLVMLGSLLAAGLPLLTALIGVAVGLLGAVTVTHWVSMTDVTPALALMLGLAVGIDYALFLVNRHREQLARGMDLHESIGRATGTAGNAVLFAGMTVIVALAALAITRIPFLATMGYVAAATVGVAVLVALTFTPAVLRLIGPRVLSAKGRARLTAHLDAEEAQASAEDAVAISAAGEHPHAGGHGWGGLVTRHPVVALVLATAFLGTLAVPAAALRLGLPDGSYEPHGSTAYRTYSTVETQFGAGTNGPIVAVAKLDPTTTPTATSLTELEVSIAEKLKATDGVAYVVPIGASDDRVTLAFQLVPTTGPSDDATSALVTRLRADAPGVVTDAGLVSLGFTGQTVANIDISKALAAALPIYLAVVVGISLLLLLLVFRSVVVPVLATAGFLLSVAAAFGGVVAVYQWGWLGGLFGVERPGLVLSFLPTLVIGILFGLAMDYQMFLVTGMREAWAHGHTARAAVRAGFSHGARVVTAAALIMMSVFGSFVHAQLTMIRPIGFALAFGVLIDAFVVRMTAMPAIMHLLGERAWYLPRWLRWLPDLDVEGASLTPAPAEPITDSLPREPVAMVGR